VRHSILFQHRDYGLPEMPDAANPRREGHLILFPGLNLIETFEKFEFLNLLILRVVFGGFGTM
jgi:hypothetical protein